MITQGPCLPKYLRSHYFFLLMVDGWLWVPPNLASWVWGKGTRVQITFPLSLFHYLRREVRIGSFEGWGEGIRFPRRRGEVSLCYRLPSSAPTPTLLGHLPWTQRFIMCLSFSDGKICDGFWKCTRCLLEQNVFWDIKVTQKVSRIGGDLFLSRRERKSHITK